ncbi:hypothetical protein R6Q59_030184 [Mikania micrantha]|uniref:Uncharacterized protein n=1 Tax=Mikania micrantha TaxID=192012 RepID=A0A5N6LSS0_9ASTR|nr:hypothetical protein E3N88_37672 [Mikania micrantha]
MLTKMDSFRDTSSLVDADDTTFYQELTRRILMLTDEDDDKDVCLDSVAELQRRPVVVYGSVGSRMVGRNYYNWLEAGRCSVPSWMESLWASGGGATGVGGGGTGVFIPSGATTCRRGKKSGRRRYGNKATKNNNRGSVCHG